ncbi:hypothetical protein TRFO_09674 [Tritrichomonas foetus]|uniref:Uncharacterized protein n=1 Tax=Tritrichomonas foetus TaxID=1144522 RepID=A0A1J4JDD3_9EUKA|nr:hypothetical protein TRFO_09674 [Tritrichomonas foetus]|eukprot:OHS97104.1 hypothetical protein TRFO_09674 [Tritrichomonas foetus]
MNLSSEEDVYSLSDNISESTEDEKNHSNHFTNQNLNDDSNERDPNDFQFNSQLTTKSYRTNINHFYNEYSDSSDFHNVYDEEEEEEEENDKELISQAPDHLSCHPEEELPKVALCVCNQLLHPECLRCVKCNNQIIDTNAFLRKIHRTQGYEIFCMKCARKMDAERMFCHVCHGEIRYEQVHNKRKGQNTVVEFQKGLFVHKVCLHCQICGLSENRKFQCIYGKSKNSNYIICENCISIMNGAGTSDYIEPFVGRFIPEILPKKFEHRCHNCHSHLSCNGFIFANQSILCVKCGNHILYKDNKK